MKRGWASGIPQPLFNFVPGQKTFRYIEEHLWLDDSFFVAHGSKSSYGTTVIWTVERGLRQKPVWVMHYGGWYDKRVIPFLKSTLASSYTNNVFMGGRGPIRLEGNDHMLQYLNRVEQNSFENFRGHEQIITTSEQRQLPVGTQLGEHHYFGGTI